jgi:UDP-N-acetylglucosamine--N-acetylmuramyl-(pentapeptide) pyrophosphoryl-undecaprenol N-acetylglucosamine transferase
MRILVVSGVSGGHIFPALGFLDTLKHKDSKIEVLLVLPKSDMSEQIRTVGFQVNHISISSIKLSLNFKNLLAVFRFLKGSLESMFIILKFKPAVVVGFGSLVTIPMVLFAKAFRIKTLIHEQNVIPGKANRFLARFTDRIALSFSQSKDYLRDYHRKTVVTGNPIRGGFQRIDKNKALGYFGFSGDRFTMLVMGGSLGSHTVNKAFLKALIMLNNPDKLQVIHISGIKDYDFIKQAYQGLRVKVKLFSFLDAIQYAYSASDLVLSRAGATTINEIIFFGLPAIIIPYPYAHEHQLANAEVLRILGAAVVVREDRLDTPILKDTIDNIMNNHQRLAAMRSYYTNISKNIANDLLVDEALFLYNQPMRVKYSSGECVNEKI